MSEWSDEDVKQLLNDNNLAQYSDLFMSQKINGATLADLTVVTMKFKSFYFLIFLLYILYFYIFILLQSIT